VGGNDEQASGRRTHSHRLRLRERIESARADTGYAIRTLVRQPAFAIVVILTFALGIGANATMFAVIDRLLLQPPPHVRDPGGVFELSRIVSQDAKTLYYTSLQYPLYAQVRADSMAFREFAATSFITAQSLGTGANAESVNAVLATSNDDRRRGGRCEAGVAAHGPAVSGLRSGRASMECGDERAARSVSRCR
jgi:hypothetical protein